MSVCVSSMLGTRAWNLLQKVCRRDNTPVAYICEHALLRSETREPGGQPLATVLLGTAWWLYQTNAECNVIPQVEFSNAGQDVYLRNSLFSGPRHSQNEAGPKVLPSQLPSPAGLSEMMLALPGSGSPCSPMCPVTG